jgi:NifU-like protein involved in Fe-S cluster formation
MAANERYNQAVRQYFSNTAHAGDLPGDYELELKADVAESEHGARIQLQAGIQRGALSALAYRVWGCPHLVAALELLCVKLEGQPIAGI